jgi:predicted hydrolase (HD superfamily)
LTIPTRREAASLLLRLKPNERFISHVAAVADVGSFLADRARANGRAVEIGLVESAALLHDIDKLFPERGKPGWVHGETGARWLADGGHPELAPPVAAHPVTRLRDQPYEEWRRGLSIEALLVAYADKRANQRLEPMSVRFARWHRKYPDYRESLQDAWQSALRLEGAVCEVAGIEPGQVQRRHWARRAIRAVQ